MQEENLQYGWLLRLMARDLLASSEREEGLFFFIGGYTVLPLREYEDMVGSFEI